MEITKELIEQNKQPFNRDFFCQVFESRDRRVIEPVLDGLGRLPDEFDGSLLVPLLGHFDANIRLLAAKNIGKLKCDSFLHKVVESLQDESNTLVRRELVSAVGRMRSEQAIPALLEVLDDPDPKVVLQAIRALLPFKQQESVEIALTELADHPNELIRSAIAQELDTHRSASKETATQHVQSPDCLKNVFVQGDVRDILANVPDQSVHLTFTSPPYYNARDYSIYQSYEGYLTFLTDVFREVHRITKEGRFFVLNTSLVIVPRMSRKHSSSRYLIPFDIH
ncbi:MAG: HEAT repeat domain-containing protein, partial [Candidatus Poribacteria bacterium]|nr:HEAT repeat domain-containing protein [Candidatus Poribacteria bacterium]